LSETKEELVTIAESHGWSLDGLDMYELLDSAEKLIADSSYTMFHPSEVELSETTQAMLQQVESLNPRRIVLDSLSELRLLAQNPLRYRRQILALKQYFVGRDCTVILLDDKTSSEEDLQLQSISHGVFTLDRVAAEYGDERRRLRVVKYRGRKFVGGWHDFEIEHGGLKIYPRIGTVNYPTRLNNQRRLLSGNSALDSLLGNGVESGTSVLMLGPAGAGKSSCSTLFVSTACMRGERAIMFIFDENERILKHRSLGLGMDLQKFVDQGLLEIVTVDPGSITPGQFAHMVRTAVHTRADQTPVSVVVIDSLNGYLSAMPEERFLQVQMHELLSYLASCNVTTFLVVAQHGMLGTAMQTPIDASYLADTVVLFRYFEAEGEIRQAISVIKKRDGVHERSIRELDMSTGKIVVGEPLRGFQGVLTGVPRFVGESQSLVTRQDNNGSS
jgi:circadian clock protein KaiC